MRLLRGFLGFLVGLLALNLLIALVVPEGWRGVVLFVEALLLMILLHEAGHFFTAKWFDIKVEEFFVGFGPRLWSTRRGETEYGIKAIPAGGYVRIAGMNPFQEPAPEDRDRIFGAKPAWQRAIVLAAGSFTHFVLAILLLASLVAFLGVPVEGPPLVGMVEPRLSGRVSPAASSGMEEGDQIVEVNGEPIDSSEELVEITSGSEGQEMVIVVVRDGERVTLRATPVLDEIQGEQVARLGIRLELPRETEPIHLALWRGIEGTGEIAVESFKALGRVFSPSGLARIGELVTGQAERSVEDPLSIVGAGRLAGQAASTDNYDILLAFLAALNVFVGIVNILPLPPLDGGHLAVVAWEKVSGRKVDMARLIPLTAAVAGLLILLTLALAYLDVANPVPDPFR